MVQEWEIIKRERQRDKILSLMNHNMQQTIQIRNKEDRNLAKKH
jgi:hypothetical protein